MSCHVSNRVVKVTCINSRMAAAPAAKPVAHVIKVKGTAADDTAELERAFKLPENKSPITIELQGTSFTISKPLKCEVPAGVTLKITGAKDKWTTIAAKGAADWKAGLLHFTGQGSVEVLNLAFDAACVPIQFEQKDYKQLKIARALVADTLRSLTVRDCDFENIYGYCIHCTGIRNVLVSRTTFLNVGGHWYQNNDYDAFGDAVYISRTPEGGDAVVEYCDIRAYPHPQYPLSRIGVTFEFCKEAHTALIYQCKIVGFDRAIHVEENPKSKIDLTIQNCDISAYHVGLFLFTGGKFLMEDCVFHHNAPGDYNGQSGLAATWQSESAELTVRNCAVYVAAPQKSTINCKAAFHNCDIDHAGINWLATNSKIDFHDCTFRNQGKQHSFYGGNLTFRGCQFKTCAGQAGLHTASSTVPVLERCQFDDCGVVLGNCPVETTLAECTFNKSADATVPFFTRVFGTSAIAEKGCKFNGPKEVDRAKARQLP